MNLFLQLIAEYATMAIVVFGLVITVLLVLNGMRLSNHKNKIIEALDRKNSVYSLNASSKEINSAEDESTSITPDTIRKYEMDFNKVCSWHTVLSQLIPIFPLLGILGTVTGLMLHVETKDMAAMMGSLGVALETTFLGLIFAILLKAIDAVWNTKIINEVDVRLDDFDKKLDIAKMFQEVENKK